MLRRTIATTTRRMPRPLLRPTPVVRTKPSVMPNRVVPQQGATVVSRRGIPRQGPAIRHPIQVEKNNSTLFVLLMSHIPGIIMDAMTIGGFGFLLYVSALVIMEYPLIAILLAIVGGGSVWLLKD